MDISPSALNAIAQAFAISFADGFAPRCGCPLWMVKRRRMRRGEPQILLCDSCGESWMEGEP